MFYNLLTEQENYLQQLPETGMGYQVIEAQKAGRYIKEKFLVLNSEIVIDMDGTQSQFIKKVIVEGTEVSKFLSEGIVLNAIRVLNENEFKGIVNESAGATKGAIDSKVENADGKEIFVRLSAFSNDRRIDRVNNCLRPGSYTTTMADCLICKNSNDDPVERYALPNAKPIQHAFHIQPLSSDTLQRGIVQPAYGRRGGGKEAYFANGTSKGTFLGQTPY